VAPYIKEHMNVVRSKFPGKDDYWIKENHIEIFNTWLQLHLLNDTTIGEQLYLLAATPSATVLTFQGYEINGNTFTRSPKIKRALTKTVVSALMQYVRMGKRTHTMVT
jgi:hypothetical protein